MPGPRRLRLVAPLAVALCAASSGAAATKAAYDPLAVPAEARPRRSTSPCTTPRGRATSRSASTCPPDKRARAVVLFSHGLGGSREGSAYLGEHWAARGYVVVLLQHPGSDDVGVAGRARRAAHGRDAAGGEPRQNFLRACRTCARCSTSSSAGTSGRATRSPAGSTCARVGHVRPLVRRGDDAGGQRPELRGPRARASPTRASRRRSRSARTQPAAATPQRAFGAVKIPWMLMTGTRRRRADRRRRRRLAPRRLPRPAAGEQVRAGPRRRRALRVHRPRAARRPRAAQPEPPPRDPRPRHRVLGRVPPRRRGGARVARRRRSGLRPRARGPLAEEVSPRPTQSHQPSSSSSASGSSSRPNIWGRGTAEPSPATQKRRPGPAM